MYATPFASVYLIPSPSNHLVPTDLYVVPSFLFVSVECMKDAP